MDQDTFECLHSWYDPTINPIMTDAHFKFLKDRLSDNIKRSKELPNIANLTVYDDGILVHTGYQLFDQDAEKLFIGWTGNRSNQSHAEKRTVLISDQQSITVEETDEGLTITSTSNQ